MCYRLWEAYSQEIASRVDVTDSAWLELTVKVAMESFSVDNMHAKPLMSRNLGIVYFCVRALVLPKYIKLPTISILLSSGRFGEHH